MFVTLAAGVELTDELVATIKNVIRAECSPRHVPDRVFAVSDLPRTLTGKILEIPVKRLLMGAEPDTVASRDSLANPGALDEFQRSRGRILDALCSVVTVLPALSGLWSGGPEHAFAVHDPATGREIAAVRGGGAAEVDAAVRRARAAYDTTWRHVGARERGALLAECSRLLRAHADELAELESWEMGKPRHIARDFDVQFCVTSFAFFGGLADKLPGAAIDLGPVLARTVPRALRGGRRDHPVQLAADPHRGQERPCPRRGQLRAAQTARAGPPDDHAHRRAVAGRAAERRLAGRPGRRSGGGRRPRRASAGRAPVVHRFHGDRPRRAQARRGHDDARGAGAGREEPVPRVRGRRPRRGRARRRRGRVLQRWGGVHGGVAPAGPRAGARRVRRTDRGRRTQAARRARASRRARTSARW